MAPVSGVTCVERHRKPSSSPGAFVEALKSHMTLEGVFGIF